MKRTCGFNFVGLMALMAMLVAPVWAQNIQVNLNGSPLSFGSVPPASVNGRVLVPLRGVFEALGAQVDYQAASRTVLAAKDATNLRLQIGSATAYVNGNPVKLDVPAQVVLGRTLVPLRFVSEALGAQVSWNPGTQTVSITSAPKTTPPPYNPPSNQNQTVNGNVVRLNTNPASITINNSNGNHTYPIAANAQISLQPKLSSGDMGGIYPASLDEINIGEEVTITLNNANQATQVVAMPQVISVKVRNVNGRNLVLDDQYGTRVTIGNGVAYTNTRGQTTNTPDVRAGDNVVLFIAGQTIYRISADAADLRIANGDVYQPPYNPPSGNNIPTINIVQHNAVAPLNAGATVKVTVRGTEGLRGSFDISQDITNLPLHENNPGVYTGSYRVRAGDDVYQGYVTAHLASTNGYAVSQQSQQPLTIDTKAPLIISTRPENGSTVDITQPNIIIYTDDQNGSGLAPATLTLRNNGKTYQVETTVAPPQSVRAIAPQELSGLVEVQGDVADNAGNITKVNFSFTIEGNTGPIKSIHHNAARALAEGDALTVDMTAPTGGRASFDLVEQDDPNHILVQGIPMVEINARHYRGTYNVLGTRDVGVLTVVGRFRDKDGELNVKDATTPVEIVSQRNNGAPVIKSPVDGDNVTSPLIVRGTAIPRNTVQVNVRATGAQYYILPYEQDLGTFNVRVNRNGSWQTDPIDLPHPKNVTGLKFIITAVQQTANDQTSPEATVTVQPQ